MSKQNTPMNRADYLLSHLAQEASELAIRCTKAQMFGLDEIQPEQEFTNRERIMYELYDLLAMYEQLRAEKILPDLVPKGAINTKRLKAGHFSDYSRELGRLQ